MTLVRPYKNFIVLYKHIDLYIYPMCVLTFTMLKHSLSEVVSYYYYYYYYYYSFFTKQNKTKKNKKKKKNSVGIFCPLKGHIRIIWTYDVSDSRQKHIRLCFYFYVSVYTILNGAKENKCFIKVLSISIFQVLCIYTKYVIKIELTCKINYAFCQV